MINLEVDKKQYKIYKVVGIKTLEGRVHAKTEQLFYTYEVAQEYAKELQTKEFSVALEVLPYGTFFEYGQHMLDVVEDIYEDATKEQETRVIQ